jgi:hypothetical protein
MGMPSRTILHMHTHTDTRMGTRVDPSTPRRTGRSMFGVGGVGGVGAVDGVATAIGTVTSTGTAVGTLAMVVGTEDMAVATGGIAKTCTQGAANGSGTCRTSRLRGLIRSGFERLQKRKVGVGRVTLSALHAEIRIDNRDHLIAGRPVVVFVPNNEDRVIALAQGR